MAIKSTESLKENSLAAYALSACVAITVLSGCAPPGQPSVQSNKFALESNMYQQANPCLKRFIESVSEYNYFAEGAGKKPGTTPLVANQMVSIRARIYQPQACEGTRKARFHRTKPRASCFLE